jgi:hypothetical protein
MLAHGIIGGAPQAVFQEVTDKLSRCEYSNDDACGILGATSLSPLEANL